MKNYEWLTKRYNIQKFMASDPYLMEEVGEHCFYEHPIYGDESPLVVVVGDVCGLTTFWDVPTIEELED